jgi:hypothetical protein
LPIAPVILPVVQLWESLGEARTDSMASELRRNQCP